MGKRWLAVTWAGGGNVRPLVALAAGLADRGHQVAALATSSLGERLAGAGLVPVEVSAGWLPAAEDVLNAVDRVQPDALIVDYVLTGAMCGAIATGLPTIALVHTLFRALLVGDTPLPMAMAGGVEQVNETRSQLGLPAIDGLGALLAEMHLVLVTAPETLDAPGSPVENLVYTGLLVEPPPAAVEWSPPAGDDPLVVVSLGTAMSGGVEGETSLLRKIIDALRTLPVRAVVNLPDYIASTSLTPAPNVSITGFIPHAHLLEGAALLVTHAGLGSVSAALAAGVPMVCIPLDRDQPATARAVARIGAGICVDRAQTVEELVSAVTFGLRWKDRVRFKSEPADALDAMETVVSLR